MTPNDTQSATEQQAGGNRTVTDRAVQAGERLLEASSRVSNAYADAYQEAVMNIADFRDKLADAGPVDWAKFSQRSGPLGTPPIGKPLRQAARSAVRANEELLEASKKLGLAYVEACEQAMLCAVELRAQACTASGIEMVQSMGETRAEVERDVARACGDAARQMLV
jgi:ferredoxin